tara:strand:+ start:177 stop:464 length:288 start_codon:yes stop_codon:yes gene_type:complete
MNKEDDFLDDFLAEYVRFRTQLNTALGEYSRTSDESIVTLFETYLKTCGECMVIHEPKGFEDLIEWFEGIMGDAGLASTWKPMFDDDDEDDSDED